MNDGLDDGVQTKVTLGESLVCEKIPIGKVHPHDKGVLTLPNIGHPAWQRHPHGQNMGHPSAHMTTRLE